MTEVQQVPPTPLHPLSVEGASSSGRCGNCGAELSGPFCSQCGEKKLSAEDYSLRTVAHEVAEDFAHLDSKILRTLKALLTEPGLLSKVYFEGGRSRYTKPLTLFVVLNLIFFFIQPHTSLLGYKYQQYTYADNSGAIHRIRMVRDKLNKTGESEAAYAIRFNDTLQEQKKSILLFSVPMLAFALWLLYYRQGRFYVEHLVFSIHVYAFMLIALTGLVVVLASLLLLFRFTGPVGQTVARLVDGEAFLTLIIGSSLITHIFLAMRRAYSDSIPGALLRAFAVTFLMVIFTGYYHDLLFYTVYYAT